MKYLASVLSLLLLAFFTGCGESKNAQKDAAPAAAQVTEEEKQAADEIVNDLQGASNALKKQTDKVQAAADELMEGLE